MSRETTAYIGIGSNLDDPRRQVALAVEALRQLAATRLLACSDWYLSDPLGPGPQPPYVNGVARLATRLTPLALLRALQAIEQRQGRVRGERWGPRTLDLDILLFGDESLATPELRVPHPEMARRSFVLHPLAELAPALVLPDGTPLAALLAKCPADGIVRLTDGD